MQAHDFAAGWCGGIFTTVLCHPFDTVKVHCHVLHVSSPRAAFQLWHDGGFAGFYRGVSAPFLGIGLANATMFGVYGNMTAYFTRKRLEEARREYEERVRRERELAEANMNGFERAWRGVKTALGVETKGIDIDRLDPDDFSAAMRNAGNLPIHINALCAASGAVTYATIMTPFDLVKLRLQTESMFSYRGYHGAADCARVLYRQGGMRKLWLGYTAGLIRDIPQTVICLGVYGTMRSLLPHFECTTQDAPPMLISGAVAGIVSCAAWYPFDVIKTNVQANEWPNNQYRAVARHLLRTRGIVGMYLGIAPAMVRAAAQRSLVLLGVESYLKVVRLMKEPPSPREPGTPIVTS